MINTFNIVCDNVETNKAKMLKILVIYNIS